MTKPKFWRHTGGGCALHQATQHPCDESYERGRESVTVLTTRDRHGSMPAKVRAIYELKRLKGVGPIKDYSGKTRALDRRRRRK